MEALSIYVLKSAGVLSLFSLVYILLLKNDTSFELNRKFLLLGILAAFVLPAAVFTKTIQVKNQALAENFSITEDFTEELSTPLQEDPLKVLQFAGFIYLFGLSFFLIRFGLQLVSLLRIIQKQPGSKESGINILLSQEATAPFSFFKTIILNPELHSPQELEIILQHEKIHATQNHSADVLLANLTSTLLWFNPLAWLYKKSILQNLEFIADKESLAKNISRKRYQETLLKICMANFQPALSNSFYQSFIKKRILMLHKESTSNNLWKFTAVLPLLLAFLLVFNVKTLAQVKASEEDPAHSWAEQYSVSFSKNSSTTDLEVARKFMLKQNLQLEYEAIRRSPEGLLKAITVNYLNKINNDSGSFRKNDPEGISSFVIFVNKNGETTFAETPVISTAIKNSQDTDFAEIGANPLFIINGKEYQAVQLQGKSIRLKSGVVFISPDKAAQIKKYGAKAKDGILLVSKGEIIADFPAEMKKTELEKKNITLEYLQIEKGSKPSFLRLKETAEESQTSKNKSSVSFNVGAAKDEAVIKLTKEEKEQEDKKNNSKAKEDAKVIALGRGAAFEKDKPATETILAGDSEEIYAYQKDSESNLIGSVHNQDQEKPLYVLDNKELEKDFDINSINPEEIASINVLKGEHAIAKYGKDAAYGVIEITTKKAFLVKGPKIFVIRSSFSDTQLQGLKAAAEQQTNFRLNFKNIKRNSAGKISSIDVSLAGKGKKASASYQEEDGVPPIYIGEKKEGGIIISSSPAE